MLLDRDLRIAVLELARTGHTPRAIARALKISRGAVGRVLESREKEVPSLERGSWLLPHRETIEGLHAICGGNLVRVHEELEKRLIESWKRAREEGGPEASPPRKVAYQTLTRFCRKQGIGLAPPRRAGEYDFGPGEEMQHDTSEHTVVIGGKRELRQCASLVLCFSRLLFAQYYPRFNRYWMRVFLTDAFRFFGALAGQNVVDNTSVAVVRGTGANAVFAAEVEAFADQFGFKWLAHELGHSDRKARVENQFGYIERNFLAGRTFASDEDLNERLRTWCLERNHIRKPSLDAIPCDLFQVEWPHLKKLPLWIPDPYETLQSTGDIYGYVRAHTNRYSIPESHIGKQLIVRAYPKTIQVCDGHQLITEHKRRPDLAKGKHTLPEHRHPRRRSRENGKRPLFPREQEIRAEGPVFASFVDELRCTKGGRAAPSLLFLFRMLLDYRDGQDREDLVAALHEAMEIQLYEMERVEKMVLLRIRDRVFGFGRSGNSWKGKDPA
jgi:hypothetical protein